MPKNDRLNGCLDDIDLDFMEREATPRLLMKLGIQLHRVVDTASISDMNATEIGTASNVYFVK